MTLNQIVWSFQPRAVVPPDELLHSRDIIAPSIAHAEKSPYPFGLGVYTNPRYGKKKLLPIVYVSPSAAADRNETSSVKEGWYVIVRPGTNIELRTSRVNPRWGKHDEVFVTCTYFNGECTNQICSFKHHESHAEFVSSGFIDVNKRFGDEMFGKETRKFIFQAPRAMEGVKAKDARNGAIRMEVYSKVEDQRSCHSWRRDEYQSSDKRLLGERGTSPAGGSLTVKGDRQKLEKRIRRDCVSSLGSKITEATITVYMREASWMRSKRLIDDEGRPCTHQMFLELVTRDSPQNSHFHFGMEPEEERASKKVKTQPSSSGKAAISHIVHHSES